MHKTTVPHDALIFVGDGTRAVFFRNRGSIQRPDLAVEAVLRQEDPPTREQGTDRPGRVHSSVGSQRSAVEDTDGTGLQRTVSPPRWPMRCTGPPARIITKD